MIEGLRFYIATRLERAEEHRRLAEMLRGIGWELTYDWTVHGSVQREGPERIAEVAAAEMRGVRDADVVVVLLPGGRGTHAELGMALAWAKVVVIVADPEDGFVGQDERTCAFYHAPGVVRWEGTLERLVEWLHGCTVEENVRSVFALPLATASQSILLRAMYARIERGRR